MSGLENVLVSADDILVYSSSREKLDFYTRKLLERLSARGLKLNKEKCVFEPQSELLFLGHLVTSGGVKPDPSKVEIIKKLKAPGSVEELRRFLGLVTYLSKFVPNFSDLTSPMRELLKEENEFVWSYEQQTAFESLIEAIQKDARLRYYDINQPVTLQVDASSVAVGAALIQSELRPDLQSLAKLERIDERQSQRETSRPPRFKMRIRTEFEKADTAVPCDPSRDTLPTENLIAESERLKQLSRRGDVTCVDLCHTLTACTAHSS